MRRAPAPAPRVDPWRRTSGIHRMRNRRQLAAVRALWEVRDAMARRRDTAPGRILPDAAIVAAVQADPQTPAALLALPVFGGRSTRRHVDTWFGALQAARALPEDALPLPVPTGDGPPQANRWAERDPVAAAPARPGARRGDRPGGGAAACRRRTSSSPRPSAAWPGPPPEPIDEDTVAAALRASGAREWQVLRVGRSPRGSAARAARARPVARARAPAAGAGAAR